MVASTLYNSLFASKVKFTSKTHVLGADVRHGDAQELVVRDKYWFIKTRFHELALRPDTNIYVDLSNPAQYKAYATLGPETPTNQPIVSIVRNKEEELKDFLSRIMKLAYANDVLRMPGRDPNQLPNPFAPPPENPTFWYQLTNLDPPTEAYLDELSKGI